MHGTNQLSSKAIQNTNQTMSTESIQIVKQDEVSGDTPKVAPKAKKTKGEKSKKDPIQPDQSPRPTHPRVKRGPARPHRRLAVEVIDSRITKLQKRLDRARSQIDDAGRHVEGYLRERDFRAKEAP